MGSSAQAKVGISPSQTAAIAHKKKSESQFSFGDTSLNKVSSSKDNLRTSDVQTQINYATHLGHQLGNFQSGHGSTSPVQLKANCSAPIQRQGYGVEDEEQMMSVWYNDSVGMTSPDAPMSIPVGSERVSKDKKSAIRKKSSSVETVGWRPEEVPGPYLHFSEIDNRHWQTGIGLLQKEYEEGQQLSALSANADFGVFGNPGDDIRSGYKLGAYMLQGSTGNSEMFGFDGGVLGAESEHSIGEDGYSLGTGAHIIRGAVRAGDASKEEKNDEQLRVGASFGTPGLGLRGHWGDQDKDGLKEYGFGFDFSLGGPGVSFDIKTEDPILTGLKYAAPLLGWGIDLLTDDKSTNLTNMLKKGLGM